MSSLIRAAARAWIPRASHQWRRRFLARASPSRRRDWISTAAQQPQQQGFGLIIAMLRENDKIGLQAREHFVAGLPRGALKAETAVGAQIHGFQLQRNP